jgi:hypothetical protein
MIDFLVSFLARLNEVEIMLAFLESTWPVWWILAILVLLRWFHINALIPEDTEAHTRTPSVPPASRGASP